MKLKQTTMQLSKPENRKIPKLVMLWEDVGLAIHRGDGKDWVVSHFNSGKSVLAHLKSKEQAIEGMLALRDICADWTFTLEEFNESEWKHDLKTYVNKLQQELLKTGVV